MVPIEIFNELDYAGLKSFNYKLNLIISCKLSRALPASEMIDVQLAFGVLLFHADS